MKILILLILTLPLSACIGCTPYEGQERPTKEAIRFNNYPIYIIRHGWHTGLAVRTSDIPKHLIPEKSHFHNMRYLEIGWGDKGFYQAKKITVTLSLKALLIPTDSVIHMVGFNIPVKKAFPKSEIIKFSLNRKNYLLLLRFIHNSFSGKRQKALLPLREGIYGYSWFYRGKGNYHIFRTCNKWTAQALKHADIPIKTYYVTTSESIMSQIRNHQ